MSECKVTAELRTVVGKGVNNLRLAGITPGVVYGKGSEPVAIQTNAHALAAVFRAGGKDQEIELTIGDESQMVVVQELQRHITRGDFIHIDFMRV